jgi:hypothetical protein
MFPFQFLALKAFWKEIHAQKETFLPEARRSTLIEGLDETQTDGCRNGL